MRRPPFELRVESIDSRGRARGETTVGDGSHRVVAVDDGLPGELIRVIPQGRRSGVMRGRRDQVLEPGPLGARREPFCVHAHECGGCTTQSMSYDQQLELKRLMVVAAFRELAPHVALPVVPATLGAPAEREYRNKLEYSFGAQSWLSADQIAEAGEITDRRALGFHPPGRFDRVIDLEECHLQSEPSGSIRRWIREWTASRGVSYYDAREHHGVMRSLMVRTSETGDVMAVVMFGEERPELREELIDALANAELGITSLWWVLNTGGNDAFAGTSPVHAYGERYIEERCGELRLRLAPLAFFQTNPRQAARLYRIAADWAELDGGATVFDLYSGVGSIALSLAPRVSRVVGIESVAEAVIAARDNAELNGISNVTFYGGAVESVLPQVIEAEGSPDLVIVDPPRAGLHGDAIRMLGELACQRIIYISCNPRTQAPDLARLANYGYRVSRVQPVDMFPQTRHVENIALCERG